MVKIEQITEIEEYLRLKEKVRLSTNFFIKPSFQWQEHLLNTIY
jgi:hypothetical protein